MSALSPRLYVLQRLTALIMAPLVITHIVVMIIAIQGGLDSAEILSRTQGSVVWGVFYSLFVIAVSIHAAIGLRVIAFEWLSVQQGLRLDSLCCLAGVILFAMGIYAVFAVVAI